MTPSLLLLRITKYDTNRIIRVGVYLTCTKGGISTGVYQLAAVTPDMGTKGDQPASTTKSNSSTNCSTSRQSCVSIVKLNITKPKGKVIISLL